MKALFYAGVVLAALGLAGVVWVILRIRRARAMAPDDPRLLPELRRLVPLNVAALFAAMLGLMMAVVGLILG